MAPTLQYSYLYFMNDLLSDNAQTDPKDLARYNSTIAEVFSLLQDRQSAKQIGLGVDWLLSVDNATFCQMVSPELDDQWEKNLCN